MKLDELDSFSDSAEGIPKAFANVLPAKFQYENIEERGF